MLKLLKRILLLLLALVLITSALALGYRKFAQAEIRDAVHINSEQGIQTLETVDINGLQQWIKIRGHNVNNPVLLFLHGGPGMPEVAVSHLSDLELEKHFTVVHWDQRGSGKTHREGFREQDLTVEVFSNDALALVDHLRQRFKQDKIYLLGHSWGSMLGALLARDYPERLHAFIGMGQVVNLTENEQLSLEFVRAQAQERNIPSAIEELKGLNPPYVDDPNQLGIQRKWLYYFGGGVSLHAMGDVVRGYLVSPDYSLLDLLGALRGTQIANKMWPEMLLYDFEEDAPSFDIPIYFFAGRQDYNTPSILAEQYLEKLQAPRKEIIWFENSAHIMNVSNSKQYQEALIKILGD